MNGKELVSQFRSGTFASNEDALKIGSEATDVSASEVDKLLETLSSRPDPRRLLAFRAVIEAVPDKSFFSVFVRHLKTQDPALRATLVDLLPRVNNVADHPALAALLRTGDPALRQSAAQALLGVGGRSVFDMLGDLVKEPSFAGRAEAMDVLVALAPQHAATPIAAALAVGSPAEKVKALRLLADPRCAARDPVAVVRAVSAALGDPNESVVLAAIASLAEVASDLEYLAEVEPVLSSRSVPAARAAIEGLRNFSSEAAIAILEAKLRSGPNALRMAALDALEHIGTSDVLAPLVEALGHSQIAVRQRAGQALTRLSVAGKVDLARTVIWLLRSRDVNVRRMAVELVQTIRDPAGELWPKLVSFLRDEDWWVRERVMDALSEMAGEALVPHVVTFLNDPDELIRRFGVDALLRLRSPSSLGTLVRTAGNDPDWWVRERAIEAVGAIRDRRAEPHLVDLMQRVPQLQVVCLQALAQLGTASSAKAVSRLLASDDPDVQLAALRCLSRLDDSSQGAAVQPLTRDTRTEIRVLARELVKRWGERVAAEAAADPLPVLDQMLVAVARHGGDDLILSPGRRPFLKKMGRILPLGAKSFSAERVRSILLPQLSAQQLRDIESKREVDFSYRVESEDLRFRVNVFQQLGGLTAVFRIVRAVLPDLDTLGLPPVVRGLADLPNGLVLVGGATGAGKSTTLAALVDHINRTSRRHIVTLEDPIEVVHPRQESIVNQREVGTHTGPLGGALRATLRQDPDVILVGELRDLQTISFAVSAAETGHLVFGTIHTVSAAGTVDRLINAFPAGQQDHVRGMVAGCLRAVICQYLLARKGAPGRVLAAEVMLASDAIANLIRKGKTFQIPSAIATAREQGMQLMDTELLRLAREGVVFAEEAHAKAIGKKDFESLLETQGQASPARPVRPGRA